MGGKKRHVATLLQKREAESTVPPLVRDSDEPVPKKAKWINKQRVLVFGGRGMYYRYRHLMEDIRALMPHSKTEPKMERRDDMRIINEICESRNCNKCIYFEGRKKKDLYMWVSNVSKGPSVKFLVLNAHTMMELKMTGNCLKASRPLLSFDTAFEEPHWAVIKELFVQTFGTPKQHPKSQPFFDHVFTFSIVDNKVWFRNFQILDNDGKLTEIGPRFVLDPIKIFEDSFGGRTLWDNPHFVHPNIVRRKTKEVAGLRYRGKVMQKVSRDARAPTQPFRGDPTNEVFQTKPPEEAVGEEKELFFRKK
ncbi:ribosome biogenesis protein BRX1 homolog [Oratosquilla oratoria]|uniref:ribosome biogenesis protein BRX1 homolog n=1 Tax=Oratosquilla oratoria TaxID=337810 RepID=UPI003F761B91